MSMIDCIYEQVKRTNPQMTRDKLIEELSKSRYAIVVLIMICENERKSSYLSE